MTSDKSSPPVSSTKFVKLEDSPPTPPLKDRISSISSKNESLSSEATKESTSGKVSVSTSKRTSANSKINGDALLVGTALDQLLDNLDNGTHLKSPNSRRTPLDLRSPKTPDSMNRRASEDILPLQAGNSDAGPGPLPARHESLSSGSISPNTFQNAEEKLSSDPPTPIEKDVSNKTAFEGAVKDTVTDPKPVTANSLYSTIAALLSGKSPRSIGDEGTGKAPSSPMKESVSGLSSASTVLTASNSSSRATSPPATTVVHDNVVTLNPVTEEEDGSSDESSESGQSSDASSDTHHSEPRNMIYDTLPSTSDFTDDEIVPVEYSGRTRTETRVSPPLRYTSSAAPGRPMPISTNPIVAAQQESPMRRQSAAFMDIVTSTSSKDAVVSEVPLNSLSTASKRKRDTAKSLLQPSNSNRNTFVFNEDSRIKVTNLDDIPAVTLPGLIPQREVASSSGASLAKESEVNSATNLLSPGRRDVESGAHLRRKKSLNDPTRSPHPPRIEYVVAGGVTSEKIPTYIQRQKSIRDTTRRRHAKLGKKEANRFPKTTPWRVFSWIVTCYAPGGILSCCCGMRNRNTQQAWREKISLVTIIIALCLILGFITFGFEYIACQVIDQVERYPIHIFNSEFVNIRGELFDISNFEHPGERVELWQVAGRDVSWLFPLYPGFLPNEESACDLVTDSSPSISCTVEDVDIRGHCHTAREYDAIFGDEYNVPFVGIQTFRWEDVEGSNRYMVYNGWVLDLERYFTEGNSFLGEGEFQDMLLRSLGGDATLAFVKSEELGMKMDCLLERFRIGRLENESAACFTAQIFMWTSLVTILSVIVVRFFIGLFYNWTTGRSLGAAPPSYDSTVPLAAQRTVYNPDSEVGSGQFSVSAFNSIPKTSLSLPKKSRFSSHYNMQNRFSIAATDYSRKKPRPSNNSPRQSVDLSDTPGAIDIVNQNGILRTIIMVTCYSEGEAGIRATLDSLANTDFPRSHKMLFIVADGLITGSGNDRSTPDILTDMIKIDPQFEYPPPPHSYVAVADGKKKHNMAQVYAGQYIVKGVSVPTILVVKCGTPEEQNDKKPGNRGKRDSQLILMTFLSKVMFDDRMTPLEYDLFTKITAVSSGPIGTLIDSVKERITPDLYELVLMVDADTEVEPQSLRTMSYAMAGNPKLIGLCGETQIANKFESWVTAIQVFEYFISHFLAKSFESVFGSVTCLPGCFCMYRVKAPKPIDDGTGNHYFVPILANPDIVEAYSEDVVETLHKKNLYLLGEDRYLTTLMLKTFPKRKLMFVPRARCRTQVPNTFSILLSQRRRWINSTVHNLLELVTLPELCGIFCFSMQFVIFMELIGTAVLPAAVMFTIYLIVVTAIVVPPPIIPLILLGAVLGLPALLVLLTSFRYDNFFWMLIYVLSLVIWNFILPVYAFWHFDDFSWGETRKIDGTDDKGHGEKTGQFDPSKIVMKRWFEWEKIRRRREAYDKLNGTLSRSQPTSPTAKRILEAIENEATLKGDLESTVEKGMGETTEPKKSADITRAHETRNNSV